jgi:hypothetical protein
VRAENLSVDEIRSGGALFNVFSCAKIDVIDAPIVFVLWPGYGARSTGFHFANAVEGLTTAVHTHPASDECVVLWDGSAQAWSQDGWHEMEIFDVVLAPCGVEHGIAMVPGEAYWGGFAARPIRPHTVLPGDRHLRIRALRSSRRLTPVDNFSAAPPESVSMSHGGNRRG